MKKILKRLGILLAVFVAAVVVYFIWAQRTWEKEDVMVYTSMEEATLPVVYVEMFGREMNVLHGYLQDMKGAVAREALTVLPEDRALNVRVAEYDALITGISYEIRSLDLERLVERTELTEWETDGDNAKAALPIQNLLSKNQEYLMILSLDTEMHGTVRYYTRIVWTDSDKARAMVDFAADFTDRTFDYERARELVTYLETNSAEDNSSLGHVTIRSSFSQLTWGGLEVRPAKGIQVTLKEFDGIMANVQLNYQVSRAGGNGAEELYEVVDNFTMKWDPKRIYLMNFDRRTNQIFSGRRELFSGKRILLGITNDDETGVVKSPDGNQLVFTANRDLWNYDQEAKQAVKIFSFRSGKDDGIRSDYDQHDIKVLTVDDAGNVDFVVYGYMNRGIHEGMMGIALYHYGSSDNAIRERFFIPVCASYEQVKEGVDQLAHMGSNGMLYLMADHAVYGIDLNSNEYMVLADSLAEGGYAVSASESRFAWQEGGLYESGLIHLMDLDTGNKREISGESGDLMRALGFVGDDFIYGMARRGDRWIANGRIKDLPMYRLEIIGTDYQVEKQYEHPDAYISDVTVEDSRVHLNQVARISDNDYVQIKPDTIVCNQDVGGDPLAGIGWYASEERRKLYFVQVDQEITNGRSIKVSVPKAVTYDNSEMLELKANAERQGEIYFAYSAGHYRGDSGNFADAVSMAYEGMGIVVNKNQEILWNRVNRSPIKNIKDPAKTAARLTRYLENPEEPGEDIIILDARGCTLSQILYFIDRGCPVAAYTENGAYVLLSGYDQYNISIYDPIAENTAKMGLNDASGYFERLGNDFICGIFTE